MKTPCSLIALAVLVVSCGVLSAQRMPEKLDRGLVALPRGGGGSIVTWRAFVSDSDETAFNVYRFVDGGAAEKVNAEPLAGPTFLVDHDFKRGTPTRYEVRPVEKGVEGPVGGLSM